MTRVLMRRGRQPRSARRVADGAVFCPLAQADVDVERCFACPWSKGAGTSAEGPWVACIAPFDAAMPRYSSVMTAGRERR